VKPGSDHRHRVEPNPVPAPPVAASHIAGDPDDEGEALEVEVDINSLAIRRPRGDKITGARAPPNSARHCAPSTVTSTTTPTEHASAKPPQPWRRGEEPSGQRSPVAAAWCVQRQVGGAEAVGRGTGLVPVRVDHLRRADLVQLGLAPGRTGLIRTGQRLTTPPLARIGSWVELLVSEGWMPAGCRARPGLARTPRRDGDWSSQPCATPRRRRAAVATRFRGRA
jgi:hypothetical protein